MPKLSKFYELISRNANITLTNSAHDTINYEAISRSIPANFGYWNVVDFCVSNDGDFLFEIIK